MYVCLATIDGDWGEVMVFSSIEKATEWFHKEGKLLGWTVEPDVQDWGWGNYDYYFTDVRHVKHTFTTWMLKVNGELEDF